ncbi:MAG: hypothetical protein WBJ41_07705 [Chromatiaceae bacterium]
MKTLTTEDHDALDQVRDELSLLRSLMLGLRDIEFDPHAVAGLYYFLDRQTDKLDAVLGSPRQEAQP